MVGQGSGGEVDGGGVFAGMALGAVLFVGAIGDGFGLFGGDADGDALVFVDRAAGEWNAAMELGGVAGGGGDGGGGVVDLSGGVQSLVGIHRGVDRRGFCGGLCGADEAGGGAFTGIGDWVLPTDGGDTGCADGAAVDGRGGGIAVAGIGGLGLADHAVLGVHGGGLPGLH